MLFPTMTLFVPLVILVESVSVGAVVDSRWKGASSSYSSVPALPPLPHMAKSHPNDILASMRSSGVILPQIESAPVLSSVVGSSVNLPCNITPPEITDRVRLVLFFRNGSKVPIYTYDTRGQSHLEARHWSDDDVLGGRAFFRGDQSPARLVLDNVRPGDAGGYRCRVDFYRAPTTIANLVLDVIVPPEKPRVFDERGQEVRLKLGPYKVGDTVGLKCTATGGHPSPKVTWWRDHALLDSLSEEVTEGSVTNELRLTQLKRDDLHTILTCQASNNNISVPVSTSVKLDMHFGPIDVKMIGRKDPVSAGRTYEFRCQAVGARPPPTVTWWRGSAQLRDNVTNRTSPDGNVTLSVIQYVPSVRDAGKYMSCRAENPELPESSLEDGWKLIIHYTPQSILSLGSSLNGSNIKEGDDVYFECNVRANPRPYKVTWRFNENPLVHDVQSGVIISNQSLVLQNVRRDCSGIYTCVAHNIEGDGTSNPMTLNVRYAPYCKPDQTQVFGVAREETVRISCEVVANPVGQTSFEWRFNASNGDSGEMVDMPHDRFRSTNSKSVVEYVPRTELDYGSLLCWARNAIGRQRLPCVYHLIPAGTPDPVKNCSFGNQTTSSLQVRCTRGYDGGLPQSFILEAKDNHNYAVVAKIQNTHSPAFNVSGLRAGRSYVLTVYAQNAKGRSSPVTLYSFTIKEAEKHTAGSTHPVANVTSRDGISVTPILGVLVAIGCGLALVAVAIIFVLRFRPSSSSENSANVAYTVRNNDGVNGFKSGGGGYVHGSHIVDECIDDDGLGDMDSHEAIRIRSSATAALNGKSPDVIPVSLKESEDTFQDFVPPRRGHRNGDMRSATMRVVRRASPETEAERRRMRNTFGRRLSQEVSTASCLQSCQEVTYTELQHGVGNGRRLNTGYAQMTMTPSPSSPATSEMMALQHTHSMQRSRVPRCHPPPAPPPRYTSPPSSSSTKTAADLMRRDDENLEAEMPLVSFQT